MNDVFEGLRSALADRYEVERELGEGGMATVYLAEDLKHHRKVAIKVLKPELAAVVGAERFLAEIETTAGLQHPHILPLFDSGEAEGFLYYVMPYVEGESLREKLDRERQLPVGEAVRIAEAVASALDYAHRHGVVHRDVKPANILIHDGEPVVADFGIALAVQEAGGGRLTETGLSLGTPYYMSPEQATADHDPGPRSDVYSLGCVLYEMLTGDPPFPGSSAQAVLGRILTAQPTPPGELRTTVPPHVESAVLRALQKLPADRFGSAADFAAALGDATSLGPSAAGGRRPGERRRAPFVGWVPWGVAALALLALLVTWSAFFGRSPDGRESSGLRAILELPDDAWIDGSVAISRDGSRIFLLAVQDGEPRLLSRSLDGWEFSAVPGSERGRRPFLSPDGDYVALSLDDQMKRIPVTGGPPVTMDTASDWAGGAWGEDGTVVYPRSYRSGIWRTTAEGGEAERLTQPAEGELAHWWPQLLPDGEHVLFTAFRTPVEEASIAVLSLDTRERTDLLRGGVYGRYVPTGHIVFARGEALYAVPFDLAELAVTGPEVLVVDDVAMRHQEGYAAFDISDEGTLVYVPATDFNSPSDLVWVDRSGDEEVVPVEPSDYSEPALSPDGRQVAVAVSGGGRGSDVYVLDLTRGTRTRITSGGGEDFDPLWTADGSRLVYVSERPVFDLHARAPDASTPASALVTSSYDKYPRSLTPEGDTLIYDHTVLPDREIWKVPLNGSGEPEAVYAPGFGVHQASLSPDGEWLAYASDESGPSQIYVSPYAEPRRSRAQVSVDRGLEPLWTRGGRELVYRDEGRVLAVSFDPVSGALGQPEVLFEGPYRLGWNSPNYDVTADGERFLMVKWDPSRAPRRVRVVTDFFDELGRRFDR